jgi:glycosyltransferase involved in cell wall biosynthesis
MNVLYDYQIFSSQKIGGVSKYFTELCTVFEQLDLVDFEIGVKCTINTHLLESVIGQKIVNSPETKYLQEFNHFCRKFPYAGAGRLFRLWKKIIRDFYIDLSMMDISTINHQRSIELITANKFDLFHPTYYDPYFLEYLNGKKYVITVHDLIHELFPEYFSPQEKTVIHKKQVIFNANRIIAVSKKTKNDLIRIYDLDPESIDVVYHGVGRLDPEKIDLPQKFILFVGRRQGYKNFKFAANVFATATSSSPQHWLVCCGGGAVTKDEHQILVDLGIEKRVLFLEPTDRQLQYVYSKATLFLFPSLYEGFGLPILEAMNTGCPVCASDIECFLEIADTAACYFDPLRLDSAVDVVERVLQDSELRLKKSKQAFQLVHKYSWLQSAKDTLQVYRLAQGL